METHLVAKDAKQGMRKCKITIKKIIGLVFKCIIPALFAYQCLIIVEKRQMYPGLLLLPLKGLIFYKVFNTQQEESRSFAFSYFLSSLLQPVPCDKAKKLNDRVPGRVPLWC